MPLVQAGGRLSTRIDLSPRRLLQGRVVTPLCRFGLPPIARTRLRAPNCPEITVTGAVAGVDPGAVNDIVETSAFPVDAEKKDIGPGVDKQGHAEAVRRPAHGRDPLGLPFGGQERVAAGVLSRLMPTALAASTAVIVVSSSGKDVP